MATDAYDRVTTRLTEVTGWSARGRGDWKCPAHADNTASLSVNRGSEGVILHCHANCTTDAVIEALGMKASELFDAPRTNGSEQPQDVYPYVDETGALLFEVVRFPNKKFRQRRPDGNGGYEWSLGDTRRVLFRLPAVLQAAATGQTVFVCEGEKDVLAIERAGGIATCNPHGAGKWRHDYSDTLRGADVVIVRDQDPAGHKHAADVEASLGGKAKRVRVVDPHSGKDAFDHLNAGHTLDDWLRLPAGRRLERALLGTLIRYGVPDPVMVHPWLYAGGLHTIQSEPGVGKSWLSLWLCSQVMADGHTAIYIDEEGGQELAAERLAALGCDPDTTDKLFHYYPFPSRRWDNDDLEALEEEIVEAQRHGPLAVGVLDSLPDFLAAADLSENDAKEVTGFAHRLIRPFRDVGAALLVLDHLTKPDTSPTAVKKRSRYSRGSGAKLAKAHLTMLVEAQEEFDRNNSGLLNVWATKDRRGFTTLPRLTHPPLQLRVRVGAGSLRIEVNSDTGATDWQGPSKCAEDVLHFLKLNPGFRYSVYDLANKLSRVGKGYRRPTIGDAAEHLVATNTEVHRATGPRNSTQYWWSGEGLKLVR